MSRRVTKPTRAPSAEIRFEVRTIIEGDLTPERIAFAQLALETIAGKALLECPDLATLGMRVVSHQILDASPDEGTTTSNQPLKKV